MRGNAAKRMLDLAIKTHDSHVLAAAIREARSACVEEELLNRATALLDRWVEEEWQKVAFMKRVVSRLGTGDLDRMTDEDLEKLVLEAERYQELGCA